MLHKDLTVVGNRGQNRNSPNFHFLAHILKANIYFSDWESSMFLLLQNPWKLVMCKRIDGYLGILFGTGN